MKYYKRHVALAVGLLALNAGALTVGPSNGAAIIGRPLNVTFPVTLDAAEDGTCASAVLYHGDQRISRAPATYWEGHGTSRVLRVISHIPIDEPSVKLDLRVGCHTQTVTRSYVLLADLPQEVTTAEYVAPTVVKSTRVVEREVPKMVIKAPIKAPVQSVVKVRKTARPTLKLEPLDLSIDYSPKMRISTTLSQPNDHMRTAAAMLWAALQKSPEQLVQDGERLHALDISLKDLGSVVRRTTASINDMQREMVAINEERDHAWLLVKLLCGALVLAGVGLFMLRKPKAEMSNTWYQDLDEELAPPPAPTPAPVNKPIAVKTEPKRAPPDDFGLPYSERPQQTAKAPAVAPLPDLYIDDSLLLTPPPGYIGVDIDLTEYGAPSLTLDDVSIKKH